jgi:putative flippase GtrA
MPKLSQLIIDVIKCYKIQIRFVIVGVWNVIFSFGIFYLINTLFTSNFGQSVVSNLFAMIIAQIIAITNAFIFHKFITFRSKIRGIRMFFEYIKFFATYTFSFFLNLLFLYILVDEFKQNSNLSGAIILPVTAVISYYMHFYVTFKNT